MLVINLNCCSICLALILLHYAFAHLPLSWQCDDPKCQVWQHVACVIIPEKPMEGIPPAPDPFYCEICRLSRADPYVATIFFHLYFS